MTNNKQTMALKTLVDSIHDKSKHFINQIQQYQT